METQTETFTWSRDRQSAPPDRVLHVAWHIDARHRDRQRAIHPGEVLVLGRGSSELGAGVLDHPGLSREHARLEVHVEGIVVRDLGSKNGLRINGRPCREGSLDDGGVLSLPGLHLVLRRGTRRRRPLTLGAIEGWGDWLAELGTCVARWGRSEEHVLILGETGTGKLEVARALHEARGRGRFVRIDLRPRGQSTWQRELFGHVKGAFTDAHTSRDGAIAQAQGGTLCLDEVGRLPRDIQQGLLTLLDGGGTYQALGDPSDRPLDARIIAASDQDLLDTDRFEPALYHRLAARQLTLPPLRARREDILGLAEQGGLPYGALDVHTALRLLCHPWLGNVRQLLHVAGAAGEHPNLDEALDALLTPFEPRPATEPTATESPTEHVEPPQTLEAWQALVAAHEGNVSATARALGVSRETLYRWRRRLT